MKKAKLLSVIALTFIGSLFLFSCGKEEIQGPQGEQGIQGETGIGIESIEKIIHFLFYVKKRKTCQLFFRLHLNVLKRELKMTQLISLIEVYK